MNEYISMVKYVLLLINNWIDEARTGTAYFKGEIIKSNDSSIRFICW